MSFLFAGNSRIVNSVLQFAAQKQFPHAIIIDGNKGTGRHTIAKFIAQAAVCDAQNSPCDNCKACNMAISSNHPDIIWISSEDNKKNISVNQIREVRSSAFIKPHMNASKVFIIEKADSMNDQAQNAFLKILEEPPQKVIFILLCENSSSLLPTVLSRCVTLTLTPPETADAADFIRQTTDYSVEDILSALQKSRNNIGAALSLLNNSDSFSDISARFLDLVLQNKSTLDLLKEIYPLEKDRVKVQSFIAELKALISDRIIEKRQNSRHLSRLIKIYDIICELEPLLITNINLSLFLTILVSKITGLKAN